jgi:hypothetical protein
LNWSAPACTVGGNNESNVLSGYAPGYVGLEVTPATSGRVTANFFSWANAVPTAGTDYSGAVNTPVTADLCTPTTTCQ